MKKLLLAVFIIFGSAISAQAQMGFGVIGGVNLGYYNQVPPLSDAVSSLGYMIGVRGDLGSNIFFQPAVEFASYGSTITLNDAASHKMRSNFIRIPLQIGAKLFDDSPVNLEVRGGLSESFLVGFNDDASNGSPFMRSDINGMRTAAIIGGGVRVLFLKIDLEYEMGLTNFFSNNGASKLNALYLVIGGNF